MRLLLLLTITTLGVMTPLHAQSVKKNKMQDIHAQPYIQHVMKLAPIFSSKKEKVYVTFIHNVGIDTADEFFMEVIHESGHKSRDTVTPDIFDSLTMHIDGKQVVKKAFSPRDIRVNMPKVVGSTVTLTQTVRIPITKEIMDQMLSAQNIQFSVKLRNSTLPVESTITDSTLSKVQKSLPKFMNT
ncbi:hypothetical protein PVA45_06595 [Entomospira entomophila]|uniref:Uncharacterized protein n=1 Tax=Entomospira entomophila TaxID=2719988 RepID=A0A968GCM3_9SPIO|nr:hypothetical protein [Entomospira entomophilus]NIZ41168.1 hypothetical protein [Entomospira entomophilus]WDI35375.1 hypothetical protein PVA45_06595 [Entomospira entomophilus]